MIVANMMSLRAKIPAAIMKMPRTVQTRSGGGGTVSTLELAP
jgi:hypothetical protein